jgi:hypothetical protein
MDYGFDSSKRKTGFDFLSKNSNGPGSRFIGGENTAYNNANIILFIVFVIFVIFIVVAIVIVSLVVYDVNKKYPVIN